jgi:predicted O-linked N-acetylglucosamine transferase (SPINDLY family)
MRKKSQFRSSRRERRSQYKEQKPFQNIVPTKSVELTSLLNQAIALHRANRLVEAELVYQQILKADPNQLDSIHMLGVIANQRGHHEEAVRQIDLALKINPTAAPAHCNRGIALKELKRFDEALTSFDQAIALKPDYAEALYNRGNTLKELERFENALASYDKALAIKPDHAKALNNRGNVLKELRRIEEALVSYDKAIALKPDCAEFYSNRGLALLELKRFEDALANYDKALRLNSDYAEAFCNRGRVLQELNRFEDALASYDKALAIKPDYAEALTNRGLTLQALKRFEDALASHEEVLGIKPDCAYAFYNCGVALQALERLDEALSRYNRAIAVKPDFADVFVNRGVVLQELRRLDEALASYDQAIALQPDYADAFINRGSALLALKRFEEALVSYKQAFALKPDHKYACSGLAECAIKSGDWSQRRELSGEVYQHVIDQKSIISPFVLLAYSSDAALQLKCARSYIANKIPDLPQSLWKGTIWNHDKVRIAYLSADFHQHATAFLMAELFELHDRSRFEVLGVSFGADDQSEMRSRLIKSFDQFHDVRFKNDRDVAKFMHNLQVDIALDLKGYTQDSRPGILAYRSAPIQVNYLGYPGTMGADFVDYVIADKIVLPLDQQPFYTEKIVHLPECYQVNDSQRKIADREPTRCEVGLPQGRFVFCCFNNSYKITAPVFDVWMRLLGKVNGSALWLLRDNSSVEINLRKEAVARGIDPARLVFAGRAPLEDHLARHRLADLFLDTLPYNAHTTASDALWAGLPLITCRGESFAGRVAASLLNAVGLSELVTHNPQEYEALALQLARDAPLLASVKAKLLRNRDAYPLFNSKRFTRHLEGAYATMWEIWQRGESPRSFSVAPKPDTEDETNKS